LQSLEYADKPDYAMLFGLFERTMKRRGVRDTDPFDWEKAATDNLGLSGIATPTGHRENNRDATVDNDQENLEPDNRKDIRISDLDKKRLTYGVGAGDVDLVPLSPRLKEGGGGPSGGTPTGAALDRNANAGVGVAKANGSSEEKGAEDRDRNEKVDKEGDAVMLSAFNGEEERKRAVSNKLHRESGLLALDVTRTEGDYGEPLSPSARLGREAWTTSSAAGAAVTSPANAPGNAADSVQSNFNAKGTLERRSGRRMHVSVTGAGPKSSLKYRSVSTYGDNSVTQMAMMDDDNVSAAITHGGAGGVTLHSRWKSQFDDSEASANETEMKGENLQSPEHKQDDPDAPDREDGEGDPRETENPSASPPPPQPPSPTKPMPREEPPKLILKPAEDALLHPNKGKRASIHLFLIETTLGPTL
jgi:tau tubulin kinase